MKRSQNMNIVLIALIAFLVAFVICLIIGPFVIKLMQILRFGQQVRDDGPASHLKKQNVPTMGGIMMMVAIGLGALIFQFKGPALVAVLATLGYGLIGFLDDFIKIFKKRFSTKEKVVHNSY